MSYSRSGFLLTSEIRARLAPIFLVLYPLYIGLNKKIHKFLGYITHFGDNLKFSCSDRDRFQTKNTLITTAVGSLKV